MEDRANNWFWTPGGDVCTTWLRGAPESKEKATEIYKLLGIRYRKGSELYLDYDSLKNEVDQ